MSRCFSLVRTEELALEPVELPFQHGELLTQLRVLLLQFSDADRR